MSGFLESLAQLLNQLKAPEDTQGSTYASISF
uniref:Uncharacterized protein n=1 Tax=Arundo donax TaxID=35708 RepID=A0A0A9C383_ARUDO